MILLFSHPPKDSPGFPTDRFIERPLSAASLNAGFWLDADGQLAADSAATRALFVVGTLVLPSY